MKPVRILIADDHELIRRGLAEQVARMPGWEVAAEASDGNQAVELAERIHPDLIVLDLSMPEQNGLSAARRILASEPSARILILTAHESAQLAREVLEAGAHGYVLKSDAGRVLVVALQALLEGRPYFTSKIAQPALEEHSRRAASESAVSVLTAREQQILQLLAEGKSNKEVARALGISVKTAETHRSNLMRKAGITSLAELVRYAVRNRIIEP